MSDHSRRPLRTPAGKALAAACVIAVAGLAFKRLEVVGDSMRPTLEEGDRVVVLRVPGRLLRPGGLVAFVDPRPIERARPPATDRWPPAPPAEAHPRLIVKRVVGVSYRGMQVRGDNRGASTDSRQFGEVPHGLVIGRVLYRYAPADRAGRLV
jgi:signal peptidase I